MERHRGLARNARRPLLVVKERLSPDAVDTPGERSGVVSRRPSALATQSLFAGAMRSLHQIDAELVRDVADDQE